MTRVLLAVPLVLALAAPASAVVVVGGGKKKFDCFIGFEAEGTSNPTTAVPKGKKKLEQRACSGSCTFVAQLCINEPVTGCTPEAVTAFEPNPPPLPAPPTGGSEHVCGEAMTITVPLRGARQNKAAKAVLKVTGVGESGKSDKDTLILQCKPNQQNTGCGAQPPTCPANPQGGPDQLVVTVQGEGNDLDSGWTGISHNFPLPSDSQLTFCLSGCDGTTANPVCQATGETGAGTVNGTTFGPPLPLVAGGVPVCVINRFQPGPVTGTGNLVTGETTSNVNLFSDVFVTDATRVCPRCENGTCDSGTRRDQSCTVDGTVFVQESFATNKTFKLSKDCPPGGNPVSTLSIPLLVTTGTVTTPGTGGTKPCREREAQGVPVKDNDCSGPCGAPCQVGSNSCVEMVPNPSDPTQMICRDIKGGLSQTCCADQPSLSCFPTQAGGAGIVRTGRPVPPTPAVPDPTYPKTAAPVVASTFCIPATSNANIDTVSGLPGPGALIISTQAVLTKNAP